jgi:hypothetical protein
LRWLNGAFYPNFCIGSALRRLPFAIDDLDGGDFRFSRECELHASSVVGSPVSDSECKLAGLSPNPRYKAFIEERVALDAKFLKRMEEFIEALSDLDREDLVFQRQNALAEVREIEDWDREFAQYLEYYKSKLFVDLRDGRINCTGISLNATDEAAVSKLNENDLRLEEMEFSAISQKQWIYSKIDWENSILYGSECSYCWVRVDVKSMLTTYPLPETPIIGAIRKLCDAYIFESDEVNDASREPRRGRPSLPWDSFHVEVAARAKAGRLPDKKEAAISELGEWFRDTHDLAVSRTSIGQKLTPYYQVLFARDSKKSGG